MWFNFQTRFIVAAILCLLSSLVPANPAIAKPNIVFIVADDLGYRELGCFGQKLIRTPNLDELAKQGMRLTQHYSGNAVCAPSRCVLMTGKHPGHAYIRSNKSTPPEGQEPIPDSEVTLAELMREQGYVTGAFGKWGLGGPESTGEPLKQGIDRFFGYNCQGHAHSYFPSYLWSDEARIELRNDPPVPGHASLAKGADPSDPRSYDQFKGKDYAPDRINEQALKFIRDNKDRPFFLYYPTIIPHVALHVPDEELKPYLELGWKDPPFTRGKGYGYTPHFTPRAAYAAMISRMDRYVGNVLKLLDELELADNTIVVFSSDHGDQLLEHGLMGKNCFFEASVRVPFMIRFPRRVRPGQYQELVESVDLLPTLLELAGLSEPYSSQGRSLVGLISTDGGDYVPREAVFSENVIPEVITGGRQDFEFIKGQGIRGIRHPDAKMVRTRRWKFIYYPEGYAELYDLESDPRERTNLAEHPEYREQIHAMKDRLLHWLTTADEADQIAPRWLRPEG